MKPRFTDKVRRGLWLVVARSATVMEAEAGSGFMERDERECVLAASRYAEAHWKEESSDVDISA